MFCVGQVTTGQLEFDMKRYLVHEDGGDVWELTVLGDQRTVEHYVPGGERKSFTIEEFEKTEDGARMLLSLNLAIAQADMS
jgi:hypothetical protein